MSNNKPCDTLGCVAEVPEGVKHCDQHLCYALREPVPDGWRLVPISPTKEMLDAVSVGAVNRNLVGNRAIAMWDSMLEAAPFVSAEAMDSTTIAVPISDDELLAALERAKTRAAGPIADSTPKQAVIEYLASLKDNLNPKETCPHCGGHNAPYEQVDCVDTPCSVGRDFHRPPLEEVIQHIETLLGVAAPVGAGTH